MANAPSLDFKLLPEKQVIAAVLNPYIREQWPERAKKSITAANSLAKEAVYSGIVQGKGYPEVARELKDVVGKAAGRAETIARTEGHRARETGKYAATKEAADQGLEFKRRWVSAMDQNTRDTHGAMDGQEIDVYDEKGEPGVFKSPGGGTALFPGAFGIAAEDVNCRCDAVDIYEGFEPEMRRTREDDLINYGTYDKYAEAKGWPRPYSGAEPRVGLPDVGYDFTRVKADRYYIDENTRMRLKRDGISEDEYIRKISSALKDINGRADIGIRVPEDVVDKILADGRFKTQFETNTGGGFLDIGNRKNIEKNLFGIPENFPNNRRPVYGMLIDDSTRNMAGEYGDVIVILKKTSVSQRTTFTYGDSIMSNALPSPLKKPHAVSAPRSGKDPFFLGRIDSTLKGKEGIANLTDGAYAEVQIHGGVNVTDIQKIIFPSTPTSAVIKRLKDAGIEYMVGG